MNEQLKSIWLGSSEGAFQSPKKLYIAAKKIIPNLKEKDVKSFLKSQRLHNVFVAKKKPAPSSLPTRYMEANEPNYMWHADILYLPNTFSPFHFALIVIDVFSRYLYYGLLVKRTAKICTSEFKKIIEKNSKAPFKLCTDRGGEFLSDFKLYTASAGIDHFFTNPQQPHKANRAERANFTVRRLLGKILNSKTTNRIDHAMEIAANTYNKSYHNGIGCSPEMAHFDPVQKVKVLEFMRNKRLKNVSTVKLLSKYKLNQKVRFFLIGGKRGAFFKSHEPTQADEIFTVDEILDTQPRHSYRLKNQSGIRLQGTFDEHLLIAAEDD